MPHMYGCILLDDRILNNRFAVHSTPWALAQCYPIVVAKSVVSYRAADDDFN
jgi:hypothetical protein